MFYQTVIFFKNSRYIFKCKLEFFDSGEDKLYAPTLSIENMDRHKGGIYICTANNGVGKPASSQVVLHVLCK